MLFRVDRVYPKRLWLVPKSIREIQVFIRLLLPFHPGLQINSGTIYLNVNDNWIIRLSSKRVGNNEVDGGSGRANETVVHLSKSVKKSSKVEKPQKFEKSQISSARRKQAS